jgi:hypothetical protein
MHMMLYGATKPALKLWRPCTFKQAPGPSPQTTTAGSPTDAVARKARPPDAATGARCSCCHGQVHQPAKHMCQLHGSLTGHLPPLPDVLLIYPEQYTVCCCVSPLGLHPWVCSMWNAPCAWVPATPGCVPRPCPPSCHASHTPCLREEPRPQVSSAPPPNPQPAPMVPSHRPWFLPTVLLTR